MKKRMITFVIMICLILSGCSNGEGQTTDTQNETTDAATEDSGHASESTVSLTEGEYRDEELDDSWSEADSTKITLTGDAAEIEGSGAAAEGSVVTISAAGSYVLTGELTDGRIIVNVAEGDVKLILNGVSITSADDSAIDIKSGDTIITLAEGSSNYVSDSEASSDTADRNNAAIYAKDDLIFNGSGSLEVEGVYKNAIQSKDELKFISGTYTISAVNHGLVGKDCIMIKDGEFNITSTSDGMQATNVDETDQGYIIIDGGSFQITSGTDAIQAETLLRINSGDFELVSGGGSAEAVQTNSDEMMPGGGGGFSNGGGDPGNRGGGTGNGRGGRMETQSTGSSTDEDTGDEMTGSTDQSTSDETTGSTDSTKGLKSYVELIVAGGSLNIDACDDGIHSNDSVTIDGGEITINAGDDGIHADNELIINNGTINIETSYEGLEGYSVAINGGTIDLTSSDDGINAAQTSSDNSGEPGMGGSQGAVLTITGGDINVNASGDGLDANGTITMTGGNLVVQGPVMGGNGTYDFDEDFILSGGTVMSVGSPQMAQAPGTESTQGYITGTFDATIAAGTTVTVTDGEGAQIASFTTEKESSWYMFSTPEMQKGSSYTVTAGDVQSEVTAE